MTPARPERIGVLGGTFDPVHIGHLVAALGARHTLGLDRVLLVVANEPWQKVGARRVTPAGDRFDVVAAAVEGLAGVEASRIELDRGGPSYTADTLAVLAARHPGAELFCVIGEDLVAELPTWARVDEIRDRATLAVVVRGGAAGAPDPPGWRVARVPIPAIELSSSDLRERLADGRPVELLIPPGAIRSIRRLGLYAVAR